MPGNTLEMSNAAEDEIGHQVDARGVATAKVGAAMSTTIQLSKLRRYLARGAAALRRTLERGDGV